MAIHSNFYFSTLLLTWQKDAEETRHVMPLTLMSLGKVKQDEVLKWGKNL